ncbi:MAG: glycosyltransferase family 4 protein [Bacteroidia bacterium]|nr:glycosyltransferase family 4 protein [Bacteroidia bacterium]
MKKPSVIFLFGKLPPPYMGPAIATETLLRSGLKDRFDLVHIDTKINEDLKDMGSFSLKKIIRNLSIYKNILKKNLGRKPDLVLIPISQSTIGFLKDSLYILLSRIFCRNILLHLRGSEFREWMDHSGAINRMYVRFIFGMCSGVIVLGENLKYLFKGYFPDERIFVAANGGDYTIPPRNRIDTNPVSILYLGNLQASKGIEDLVEAIHLLPAETRAEIEVTVIGGWRKESTRTKCLDLTEKHHLPIRFLGPEVSTQKLQYMSNADIFVFPPRAPEGHPWVLVEAMAAGLPIISTDRGAIVESVKDGENGFIVPLEKPEAIAQRLEELISNQEKRQRMGLDSRKKYEAGFTEAHMVKNLEIIFNRVITA